MPEQTTSGLNVTAIASQPDGGRSKLVLIVEDEAIIALELAYTLEEAGYDILGPAMSIARALALIEAIRPDAAVLDVNVRSEKITQVARRLKGLGVPFVLTSAYGPSGIPDDPAFDQTVNVGKPTDRHRLLAALDTFGVSCGAPPSDRSD
jgi:two-component system, response regulator PdtaR